jgi:hypothetical protein
MSAGFYFPNEQQLDYYMLADLPFSATELQQLHSHYLAPWLASRSVANSNRGRAVRESVVTVPKPKGRIETQYTAAVSGPVVQMADAVPELSQQQQQQQQQPSKKKQKVSEGQGGESSIVQSAAASKLLLVLRCFQLWESRQVQEKELPQLLQLLLHGQPAAAAAEAVIEVVDLVSDDENGQLDRQLLEGGEEVLLTKEVVPKERNCWWLRRCCQDSSSRGSSSSSGSSGPQ